MKRGAILLRTDDIQPAADAQAGKAGIESATGGTSVGQASCVSAQADVKTQQANLENNRISWDRGQELYKQGLIPKQDYDTRKTLYDGSVAAVASALGKGPSVPSQR